MKDTIIFLALISGLGLAACDKTPNTVIVPMPVAGPVGATGAAGQSGDIGVQGKPGKAGDEGVQGEPGKTGGDTTIILSPPAANMPPEIVPEPSSVTPAK